MGTRIHRFKCIVTAFLAALVLAGPAVAQQKTLDALYQELIDAGPEDHDRIAGQIIDRWETTGSAAMDLLLRRGQEALEAGDPQAAVEHLTALVDHAPDFAEGYHARASAYFQLDLIGPALDDLGHALALNPRHFDAMFGLGAVFEGLERPERALEAYREVLKLYPLDPEALEAVDRITLTIEGQAI